MLHPIQKIIYLIELLINGCFFILLYFLKDSEKISSFIGEGLLSNLISIGAHLAPVIILASIVVNLVVSRSLECLIRNNALSIILFVPLLITWGDQDFAFYLSFVHVFFAIASIYKDGVEERNDLGNEIDGRQPSGLIDRIKLRPAQMVLLSFSGVILIGTFLLMLPFASNDNNSLNFVDAIFLATSATCVTGLSTLSVADHFSAFGQIVILLMIQIGGLSIMTLYSSMSILLGKAMAMKHRVMMQDFLDVSSLEELFAMISDIIKYTFLIELWGAIVLTIAFTFEGHDFGTALWYGFFHSISAFCNAGFSLFNSSLESFATNPLIHGTIAILITLGGLGFIVLKEMKAVIWDRKKLVNLGLHAKVVLVTSIVLTVAGTFLFFFGEYLGALDHYSLWEKIQISFFQSVTLRTAGFNSVPLTNLNTYTIYAMTLFMFIGASPGSTGGGVKTTTLAILIQSITSTLKGRKTVGMLDRRIPNHIVVRATALTFISIIIASVFILLLMALEPEQSFLAIFFEVVSASGTVGLSLGVTPYLSVLGKFAISLIMLIGRIGPLTLVLAIGEKSSTSGKVDYPSGRIMLG